MTTLNVDRSATPLAIDPCVEPLGAWQMGLVLLEGRRFVCADYICSKRVCIINTSNQKSIRIDKDNGCLLVLDFCQNNQLDSISYGESSQFETSSDAIEELLSRHISKFHTMNPQLTFYERKRFLIYNEPLILNVYDEKEKIPIGDILLARFGSRNNLYNLIGH